MTVCHYRSTDTDAPILNGSAGSLITVLDACLVNGYSTGMAAKAPAGWAKSFAVTHKAAYRPPSGLRFFYRINDAGTISANGATRAHLLGAEMMTDIDTHSGRFPNAALPSVEGMVVAKSSAADATARPWTVIADEAGCYVFVEANGAFPGLCNTYYFGDFISYGEADPYAACVIGDPADWAPTADPRSNNAQFANLYTAHMSTALGQVSIARHHNGSTNGQRAGLAGASLIGLGVISGQPTVSGRDYNTAGVGFSTTAIGGSYPAAVVGLALDTLKLVYGGGFTPTLRGFLPGLFNPLHNRPFPHQTEISNVRSFTGRTMLALDLPASRHEALADNTVITRVVSTGQCLVDLTGPWR